MTTNQPKCSMPDCRKAATHRIAAPWSDGVASGSRSYGHACSGHVQAVIECAQHRLRRSTLSPGESIGDVVAYRCEVAPVALFQPL